MNLEDIAFGIASVRKAKVANSRNLDRDDLTDGRTAGFANTGKERVDVIHLKGQAAIADLVWYGNGLRKHLVILIDLEGRPIFSVPRQS